MVFKPLINITRDHAPLHTQASNAQSATSENVPQCKDQQLSTELQRPTGIYIQLVISHCTKSSQKNVQGGQAEDSSQVNQSAASQSTASFSSGFQPYAGLSHWLNAVNSSNPSYVLPHLGVKEFCCRSRFWRQ